MTYYSEFVRYSPIFDTVTARISMVDSHNQEFFVLVPGYGEKGYSERRDEALEVISEAIARGLQPGQVIWRPTQQTLQHAGSY